MALLKNKNFASSLVANVGGISAAATSVSVTSSEGSLFPSSGFFMAAIWGSAYASPALDPNRELVKMTLTSGDTFTITRAQEGTSASAWSQNDNIAHVLTAGKVVELEEQFQANLPSFAIATGTNTYTAVMDPAVTSYTDGMGVNVRFTNGSTGASTLQLNALAGKKIYKLNTQTGAYAQAGSGDIISGMAVTLIYNSSLDAGAGGWQLTFHNIEHPTEFSGNTALLFPQASAPTGWTLDSNWGTPRSIVIGNSYGIGGTDNAVSFTTGVTVGNHASHTHTGPNHSHGVTINGHALTIDEMPSHNHTDIGRHIGDADSAPGGQGWSGSHFTGSRGGNQAHNHGATTFGAGTGNTGSGGPTAHSVGQSTYSPRYITVIRATKDP